MDLKAKILNLASRQVGYKETGTNHTKYWSYFDDPKGAWQWFNTKKQGTEWCAGFICWLFCQNETLGPKEAYSFLGMPKNKDDNCAAACPYFWQYLKAKGYQVDKKSGQAGDIIFFNSKCSHVGIIEKVDDKKYYTIEGNKSNQVKRCSYSRTSSSIYGIMRPNYSKYDKTESDPAPAPVPTPKPAPTVQKYQVKTNSGAPLALRVAPNTKAALICWMPNGSSVTVSGAQNGWSRTTYKGKTGWSYSAYLKKV